MKEYEKAIKNRTRILQHQERVRGIAKQFYSITPSNILSKNIPFTRTIYASRSYSIQPNHSFSHSFITLIHSLK